MKIRRLLGGLTHGLVAFLTASMLWDQFGTTLFALHPLFMAIGYVGLMAEGICLAADMRCTEGSARVTAIWRHAVVQVTAAVCVAIGFFAIHQNKVVHGKQHYHTTHGKLGLAAVCTTAAVLAGGATAFRSLGLLQLFPEKWHASIKQAHRWAAPLAWVAAAMNMGIGMGHPAAGPRAVLHLFQRVALAALAGALMCRLIESPLKKDASDAGKLV